MDAAGIRERDALEAFTLVMDSNFAPIVGQQVTLVDRNSVAANQRITLFLQRAAADECEVIAFNSKTGEGYLYRGGVFLRDKAGRSPFTDGQLRSFAGADAPITYTCVPKGNGRRLALDRNLNGVLNGDEDDEDDDR